MNQEVDKLLEYAGNKHSYQYLILTFGFCYWITLDLFSISIPYLEKPSTIMIHDKINNKSFSNITLNYSMCNETYSITEYSGHSWVYEFDIECDKIKTGLIG